MRCARSAASDQSWWMPRIRRSASTVVERGDPVEQLGQLVLAGLGEEEVVERLEAVPLVGAGDLRAAADEVGEQLALGAVPGGDPLAGGAVEAPEVLLDLAEVGQQLAGGGRELLVAVAHAGGFEQRQFAGLDGGDLRVDLVAAATQVGQPALGVGVGAVHDLPQQLDRGVQPGLGRDEGAGLERLHPPVGLLEGRGDLVVDLVVAGRVEAAQVAGVGRRPVLQVGARRLGKARLTALGVAAAFRAYRWSSSAAASSLAEQAPRLPSTKKSPRNDRTRLALPARSSRHAACRSRSASIASYSTAQA